MFANYCMYKSSLLNENVNIVKGAKDCRLYFYILFRKSRNTWSNRQIWPWSTEWSRAKANRVLPRKHTGYSKHPLPTTQKKTLHMDITRWSTVKKDWLYSLQPKMEKFYRVSKNKTGSWLWLRSWIPYCQIQTENEEGQRLTEFYQENTLVIANTLFQQHKRRLYTWIITRWSILKSDWLYSLQPKMEKLYTGSKSKTRSWLWLRSWASYCQIQTGIEESEENHQTIQVSPKSNPLWLYSGSEK